MTKPFAYQEPVISLELTIARFQHIVESFLVDLETTDLNHSAMVKTVHKFHKAMSEQVAADISRAKAFALVDPQLDISGFVSTLEQIQSCYQKLSELTSLPAEPRDHVLG